MTFAAQLKNEILNNHPLSRRHRAPYAYGLLLFAQDFGTAMRLSTEHRGVAKSYAEAVSRLVKLQGSITTVTRLQAGKEVFDVTVDNQDDIGSVARLFQQTREGIVMENLSGDEELGAFLAGAFLACGNMIDPQKSYHLEFSIPRPGLSKPLSELLAGMGFTPRTTIRRNTPVVYFRDSEQIETLLALMGATRLTWDLMNIKIYKGIRNKANRQSNRDTANIDKTVAAGVQQAADIDLIVRDRGWEGLGDDLSELARLRVEHPEASLRELGELMNPPLSRSGVNHRFQRIAALAQEIRESGPTKGNSHV